MASFDEQVRTRANLVAEKTNIHPKIVPLPQGEESFTIFYRVNNTTDTLFKPKKVLFAYPASADSIAAGDGWRSIHIEHRLENGGSLHVIYALPSQSVESKLKKMTWLIWLVLPVGCLFAFVIAYRVSSRLLKPIRQVIGLTNSINLNNDTILLKEPLANDELKELIASFNRMLLRIKEQSDRQTAFFASASHELRTPLSIMQTRLQVLLHEQQQNNAIKELYQDQLKDVQQLSKMVNDFLLLSELRSGKINLLATTIYLSDFIPDLIASHKHKAAAKNISFKISFTPLYENYAIAADKEKLFIVLNNLVENAIKYSPLQSSVDCNITQKSEMIIITIANNIRADINPQISDLKNQFYHSKPLHGEGFGLGLWIANQLAILQDMELYCAIINQKQFEVRLIINPETDK